MLVSSVWWRGGWPCPRPGPGPEQDAVLVLRGVGLRGARSGPGCACVRPGHFLAAAAACGDRDC